MRAYVQYDTILQQDPENAACLLGRRESKRAIEAMEAMEAMEGPGTEGHESTTEEEVMKIEGRRSGGEEEESRTDVAMGAKGGTIVSSSDADVPFERDGRLAEAVLEEREYWAPNPKPKPNWRPFSKRGSIGLKLIGRWRASPAYIRKPGRKPGPSRMQMKNSSRQEYPMRQS